MTDSIAPTLSIIPGGTPATMPAGMSSPAPGTLGFDAVLRGSLAGSEPAPRKQGAFADTNPTGAMIMAAAGLPLPVPMMTFAGAMPAPLAGGQSSPDGKMQTASQAGAGSTTITSADTVPATSAAPMTPASQRPAAPRGGTVELVAEPTPGAQPIWTTPAPTSTEYYPLRQRPEPATAVLTQPPVVRGPGGQAPDPITPAYVFVPRPGSPIGAPAPAPVANPEGEPESVARQHGEAGRMPVAATSFAGGEDLFISLVRELGGPAARAAWDEMVAPLARPVVQTFDTAQTVADYVAPLGQLINTPQTFDTAQTVADYVAPLGERTPSIDDELRRLLHRTFRLPEREGEVSAAGSIAPARTRDDEIKVRGDDATRLFSVVTKDEPTRTRDEQPVAALPAPSATEPPLIVTLPPAESRIPATTAVGSGESTQRPAPSSNLSPAEATRAAAIGRITTGPASVRTVDQVADALAMQVRDGRPEATITLRPVAMGEIKVQISSGQDGLVIRMSADNNAVGELLRTHMDELRDALAGHQVAVSELHVLHNPPAAAPASSGDSATWNERPWARQGQEDDDEGSTQQQPDEDAEEE